jgi:hypothetical protein
MKTAHFPDFLRMISQRGSTVNVSSRTVHSACFASLCFPDELPEPLQLVHLLQQLINTRAFRLLTLRVFNPVPLTTHFRVLFPDLFAFLTLPFTLILSARLGHKSLFNFSSQLRILYVLQSLKQQRLDRSLIFFTHVEKESAMRVLVQQHPRVRLQAFPFSPAPHHVQNRHRRTLPQNKLQELLYSLRRPQLFTTAQTPVTLPHVSLDPHPRLLLHLRYQTTLPQPLLLNTGGPGRTL